MNLNRVIKKLEKSANVKFSLVHDKKHISLKINKIKNLKLG